MYLRSFVKPLVPLRDGFVSTHSSKRWGDQQSDTRISSIPKKSKTTTSTTTTTNKPSLPLPPRRVYGEWKQIRIKHYVVKNNRVPTNEYGNVEMWTPKHTDRCNAFKDSLCRRSCKVNGHSSYTCGCWIRETRWSCRARYEVLLPVTTSSHFSKTFRRKRRTSWSTRARHRAKIIVDGLDSRIADREFVNAHLKWQVLLIF